MARIHVLPPTLVNQIAAGEVVERPASVVKELLENALDAGASRLDVDVARGGIDLIRVADNGGGIAADDLPLAFASHATSKIASTEDLFRIGTLGFRGEALASIGSIAQVTLQSRPADQPVGAEITCHGGQLSPARVWNGAPGTRIEVRHLFYNTPARRKFLKAVGTEMGHVQEVFLRLAMSHLGVHWTLRHNDRVVYDVPATMGLLDRIRQFFGADVAGALHPVQAEQGPITLGGYLGDPSLDRPGTGMQYLFLNGRWVRDRGLFQAVQEAYRGLLMTGRSPVAFLFLDLPADQVDVNVHPAKAEVRFRDAEGLYRLVHDAVLARLREADLTASLRVGGKQGMPRTTGAAREAASGPPSRSPTPAASPSAPERKPLPARPAAGVPAPAPGARPPAPDASRGSRTDLPLPHRRGLFEAGGRAEPAAAAGPAASPSVASPTVSENLASTRAMQVLDCYLVVEEPPDAVLFIDQHALHERILFEQLQERLRAGTLETQRLLIPEPFQLPPTQAAAVLEQREALASLGLLVDDFGGNTVLLAGYPALLARRPPGAIFGAVVEHLARRERLPSREQLFNDLLSLMACHGAVRAGDRLTAEEIAALLALRELAENSHHCPHGRPSVLRFSRHELERHFKRV